MPLTFIVKPNVLEIQYEAETVEEGLAIYNSEAMRKARAEIGESDPAEAPATQAATGAEPPKKRGRKPKNQPAPETATAPAPMPVTAPVAPPPAPVAPPAPAAVAPPPAPPAPPPVAVSPTDTIPAFLNRTAPPAPPAPAAPAAPKFELGNKIKAHIVDQAGDDEHAQKEWTRWLVGAGLVIEVASFKEALDCVALTPDAALKETAEALGLG